MKNNLKNFVYDGVGPHATFPDLKNQKRKIIRQGRIIFVLVILLLIAIFFGLWKITGLWQVPAILFTLQILISFILMKSSFRAVRKMLNSDGIHPVTNRTQPALYAIVEDVSERMGMATPPVWIIEDPTPNAFAAPTGWKKNVIIFHTGWLAIGNAEQTRGVVGHELGHVANGDSLRKGLLSNTSGSSLLSIFQAEENGRKKYPPDPVWKQLLTGAGIIIAKINRLIMFLFLLPFSRSRESLADLTAVEALGGPGSTLAASRLMLEVEQAARQGYASAAKKTFSSTHPHTKNRIKLVLKTCGKQASRLEP